MALASNTVKAGEPISVKGFIAPGQDLYVVISTDSTFKPSDAAGEKERKKLSKKFTSDPAIPPNYYVVTNAPETLATPKGVFKGLRQQIMRQIDEESDMPEGEFREVFKEAMGDFFDAFVATVKEGKIDGGAVVHLNSDAMTIVAGGKCAGNRDHGREGTGCGG